MVQDESHKESTESPSQREVDLAAIREGLADMLAGRTRPLREVEEDIRRDYGYRRGIEE